MLVVCDTSPLINLAILGQLHWLPQQYGSVVLPQAVEHEIVVGGAGQSGASEFKQLDWIDVRPVTHIDSIRILRLMLDEGEAEVIALAMELKADLVLLDERKARVVAARLALPVAGILDVLVEAKRRGSVAAVRPVMDDLVRLAHFHISKRLYDRVLRMAEEHD